jgi:hypothetical protein
MVNGAKGADETTKDPAEKEGYEDETQGPVRILDPFISGDE